MVLKREVESLRQQVREHTEFLEHVRGAAEPEALSLVRRLKTTENPAAVLSSYQGNATGVARPSEAATACSILPPTQSNTEFELTMLHPTVYPALKLPNSAMGEAVSLSRPTRLPEVQNGLARPLRPIPYCDPQLERLKVGYWTRVSISDELAASALSHYLEVDHPILGLFDADLFVHDLVNERLEFCSSFLFSAVMAIACQSYCSVDISISPFGPAFLKEAEKLWLAERSSDSTVTLAAINCLSIAASWNGRNEFGNHQLVADARAMAMRMQLLDVPPAEQSTSFFRRLSDENIRNVAHVAWGTYSCLRASLFPREPVRFPPMLPIPGDSNSPVDVSGFTWPYRPVPSYVGNTFTTMCKFWVISQEILAVYDLQDKRPLVDRVMPAFAESKYRKLLVWADTLPPCMGNTGYTAAHVALYHTTVLNLFRPFLEPPHIMRLRSFSSQDSTSQAVFAASFRQLKRLIYDYRTLVPRHLARSCIFNVAVQHVCSVIVQHTDTDPSWKFFFRLCFDYWKDVYVQHRVFQAVVPAHLSLALQNGAITAQEAKSMMVEFQGYGEHHKAAEGVLTDSVLDFQAAIENRGDARVDQLAEKFDELVMFDEFTTGEYGNAENGEGG
ncbi:Nn.00g073800.m01.CDS01 [Neocucurbitaria sp. VM-36]